jgi:hypothetical protein
MKLSDIDMTGAWGGITLHDGASIVPSQGGLAYQPSPGSFPPDHNGPEYEAWHQELRDSRVQIEMP